MADSQLNKEFDTLKSDVAKLRGDMASLLGTLQDLSAEKVGNAKSSVGEEYVRRRQRLRETLTGARARGERAAASVEEEIARHPVTSLVAAFGVGFVVAKLLSLGGRPE